MSKIFQRPSMQKGSEKRKKNEKNRVRNTFLNFRVTPAEKELIEARISLTGLTKAEFFIQSRLYQTILVKGNIRTFSEIDRRISEIEKAINLNPNLEELDPVQAENLKTILEIINSRLKSKSQP